MLWFHRSSALVPTRPHPLILSLALSVGLVAGVLPVRADAQQGPYLDASVGMSSSAWRAAGSAQWRLPVGTALTLRAGLRMTRYGGESSAFTNEGTVTDTLLATLPVAPSVTGANVMVSGELRLAGPISAGANVDLFGLALGASQSTAAYGMHPTKGSAFTFFSKDRGAINSELFLGLGLGSRVGLRGGISRYVVGYNASTATVQTRYLRYENVPFIALRLQP